MQILLNGESYRVGPRTTVRALLERLDLDVGRVAVEVNRRILRRPDLDAVIVRDGDEVEIVTFVGGG